MTTPHSPEHEPEAVESDGFDELLAENQPSDELIEQIGQWVDDMSRSELWTLDLEDHGSSLFRGSNSISGTIIRGTANGEQAVPVKVMRDGTCENRLRLEAKAWPEGYRLNNLVIGEFRFVEMPEVERPINANRRLAAESAPSATPAKPSPSATTNPPPIRQMAARSATPSAQPSVDVRLKQSGYLEIGVQLPAGDFVMVELVRGDGDEEPLLPPRVVHLDKPDFKGFWYGKLNVNELGDALNAAMLVRIRPLNAGDLHHLSAGESKQVMHQFLADQDFVTVAAEADGDAFVVTPRHTDQAEVLHDRNRQWALQVTRTAREG